MSILNSILAQKTIQYLKDHFSGWEYQVSFRQTESTMLRFAKSNIHQNNRSVQTTIEIELAKGLQVAKTSLNAQNFEDIVASIHSLQSICEIIAENKEFSGYPLSPIETNPIRENPEIDLDEFYEMGLSFFPTYFQKVQNASFEAFGSFTFTNVRIACFNSNDLLSESKSSSVQFQSQIMKDRVSGYAQSTAKTLQEIAIERVVEESIETCSNGFSPALIEPGVYPVFLKPEAVADILRMLTFISMSTKAIDEKRSYLSEKINQQVMDSCLQITENPLHPLQISPYIDTQGYPHNKPVHMIQDGYFREMVYDNKYAKKLQQQNTGNAISDQTGPMPMNLVLESKDTTNPEEIRSQIKKGIYITRFWYANPVSPIDGEVTALTRDGTFLIEDGIQKPIKNLRYSDNLFEVLSHVLAVGNDSRFHGSFYGGVVTPSLLCEKMRFTEILPE